MEKPYVDVKELTTSCLRETVSQQKRSFSDSSFTIRESCKILHHKLFFW